MLTNERELSILNNITESIIEKSKSLSIEQRHPGGDPDMSDGKIKDIEKAIKKLREIRNDLEEIFTGAFL